MRFAFGVDLQSAQNISMALLALSMRIVRETAQYEVQQKAHWHSCRADNTSTGFHSRNRTTERDGEDSEYQPSSIIDPKMQSIAVISDTLSRMHAVTIGTQRD
jgi:hypothetical protein